MEVRWWEIDSTSVSIRALMAEPICLRANHAPVDDKVIEVVLFQRMFMIAKRSILDVFQ
jgi:hypothetical protein